MKLSDLIEKGAKSCKFMKDNFVRIDPDGTICACPMGMAYYGATGESGMIDLAAENRPLSEITWLLDDEYDINTREMVTDPEGGMTEIEDIITNYVDHHGWTAEKVVEWLRSKEL